MKSLAKTVFAVLVLFVATLFPMSADGATISIDTVLAQPGTSFEVGVWMSNNTDSISALTIPLRFGNQYLQVDSVSFANTIKPASFRGAAEINNAESRVRVSYIPDQFVSPLPTFSDAQGLIATIHFSLASGAPEGLIAIDSVLKDSVVHFGGAEIHYWIRVEFSDQSGTLSYYPSVQRGGVDVKIATGIDDGLDGGLLPTDYKLDQNFPNPFNPTTTIEYAVPRASVISLKVYNVIGQEVASLAEGLTSAGIHRVEFDAANYPSGIYFYRLVHNEGSVTKKMILLK